jgi:tetratricopeptide (TPR) repeat protein
LAGRAQTLVEVGDYAAARGAFETALGMLEAAGSQDQPAYHQARVGYGGLLSRIGRAEEAERILRPALLALEAGTAAPHRGPAQAGRIALAKCLTAQGRRDEATGLLEQTFRIYRDHYGPENPRTRSAARALSELRARPQT